MGVRVAMLPGGRRRWQRKKEEEEDGREEEGQDREIIGIRSDRKGKIGKRSPWQWVGTMV